MVEFVGFRQEGTKAKLIRHEGHLLLQLLVWSFSLEEEALEQVPELELEILERTKDAA